jgi:predicted DNA-binding protein with PD1-like motif
MTELRTKHVCGELGRVIPLRLLPGTDLMNGLKKVCEDNNIRHGTILSAIGTLRQLTIQIFVPKPKAKLGAGYDPPQTIPGPAEIMGIQGVIFETETGEVALHLHGVFCDKEGKTLGGHIVPGGNPILATLDAVIGEVSGVRMMRRYDEETDLNLFSPEPA